MIKQNIFYLRILIDSWKLVWRNKLLWFFGLFSFIFGGGVWYNFTSSSFSGIFKQDGIIFSLVDIGIFSNSFFSNIKNAVISDWFSFFMIVFMFFLIIFISIILIFISVIAQGGLVYSVFKLNKKEKIDIPSGLSIGRGNFWRILSLNIIEKYIIWTLSFLLATFSVLAFVAESSIIAIWSFIFSIIITIILVICSLIMKYSLAFVVLKGKNPIISIKDGAILFYKNCLVNFEMAFFLFIINSIFKYIMILVAIILLIPLTSLGSFSLYMSSWVSFNFYFIFIPCFIVLLILFFISMLVSYNYSVWTLMFIHLNNNKRTGKSVMVNLASKFKK
ncbi:MAG: hypothetical protein U9O55_02725 [Patescibacteria group bacterium]|nr:hypothetical protein [Patescibacteria group bacterium]